MLKKFFTDGVKDQIKVMGEECKILDRIHQKETETFNAVVTPKQCDLTVEVGAITYNIDAHALIPATIGQEQIIGNRLKTKEGEYIITSAVKSHSDAAYSCDLVKIKSI